MIGRRSKRIQLSPIKEIELAAARRPGVVSLAQGIPDFDTPKAIKSYVKEKLDQGETARYSLCPGLVELRELVAESLRSDGMRYDPDGEILITAGAIEGIAATLIALTDPGQEVLLPAPSYASYQQVIRVAGCEPRFVPLDEENNFDLDVDAIERAINARTAAIFYCNPNNPTGTIYSREQSLRMMELAQRHDLFIITDEVYKDFIYGNDPVRIFTPAQEDAFRDRVVRIFSFSKAYAMTGWRVGYLHSDRSVVNEILKIHDALVTCAPVASQHAAVAALTVAGPEVEVYRRAYHRRRTLTLRHLDALSHVFDYQRPRGAYFVFPRVKDTVPLCDDSRQLAFDLLERAGVALVPGSAFGPSGEGHLRISFSRHDDDIEEAFSRMKQYFRGASSDRPTRPTRVGRPAARRRSGRGAGRRLATSYLQAMARLYLQRRCPTVIAIAGFLGKTVFKRVLSGLLRRTLAVRANPRSYNTEIGLPLAVLGLEIDPRSLSAIGHTLTSAVRRALLENAPLDVLVLELGVRQPGDMKALLRVVQPDWAVVTGIGERGVEDRQGRAILQQEIELLLARMPAGRALLCVDDPFVLQLADQAAEPMILRRKRMTAVDEGFRFASSEGEYLLGADIADDSSLYALQAAILLGERLGVAHEQIADYLATESGLSGS